MTVGMEARSGSAVVVGGTSGIGRAIALELVRRQHDVVITGRSRERAEAVAVTLGAGVRGLDVDLTEPETIGERLGGLGPVTRLCLVASVPAENRIRAFDVEAGRRLVVAKLVGYAEVVHTLAKNLSDGGGASVLLLGGHARKQPYDGSTSVTSVNGGVASLVRSLAVELAPIRVNGLHPGPVGDSDFWRSAPADVLASLHAGTLTGKLPSIAAVVEAAAFLLDNEAITGVNLDVESGSLLAGAR